MLTHTKLDSCQLWSAAIDCRFLFSCRDDPVNGTTNRPESNNEIEVQETKAVMNLRSPKMAKVEITRSVSGGDERYGPSPR